MIQDIKNTFMENLEQLEWMDEPTRKLAERKVCENNFRFIS